MFKKEDHQRVFSNKQIINIAQELNDKLDLAQYHSEITFTGKSIRDFVISRVYHTDQILKALTKLNLVQSNLATTDSEPSSMLIYHPESKQFEICSSQFYNLYPKFSKLQRLLYKSIFTQMLDLFTRQRELEAEREAMAIFQVFYELSYLVLDYFPSIKDLDKFILTDEMKDHLDHNVLHTSCFKDSNESKASKADSELFAREMILPHAEANETLKRTKQQGWDKVVATKFLTIAYPLPIGIAKTIVNENW